MSESDLIVDSRGADGDGNDQDGPNQNANESFSMNPLEMSEILEVVVLHCPVETLKTIRLVCDLWRTEATPLLFKRGYFTVPENFHNRDQIEQNLIISHMKKFLESNKFPESSANPPRKEIYVSDLPPNFHTLDQMERHSVISNLDKHCESNQFTEFSENPRRFEIRLPNVQILQHKDLQVFDKINLKIISPLVKKFVFGVHEDSQMLEQLLMWRLTGLRVLDTIPRSLGNKKLPLSLHFCRDLMQICGNKFHFLGNPERPRNLSLTLVDLTIFVDCGADPHSTEKLSWLNRISNSIHHIFITKLSFGFVAFPDDPNSCCPDVRERISGVLSRFLEQSKDVLTSLRLWGCEMYLAETIVPILPKLQFLELVIYSPRKHAVLIPPKYNFPPNFQFSINMPNLNEVDISYSLSKEASNSNEPPEDQNTHNFLAGYFDGQKPAVSLKNMTYCDHGWDFELDPVLKCFSKLETLSFNNFCDFRKGARSIVTWGKELKNLRIGLILDNLTSKISSFDSILTGFSQGAVDKIKNAPSGQSLKEIMGESGDFNIDSLRIQPSILDLPKLELISFKMLGNCVKYLPKKIFAVAGEYGFKLRPKLKVEFHVGKCQQQQRAKDALKDVAQFPNVEIVQES